MEAGQLVVEAPIPPICRERLDHCVYHFQPYLSAERKQYGTVTWNEAFEGVVSTCMLCYDRHSLGFGATQHASKPSRLWALHAPACSLQAGPQWLALLHTLEKVAGGLALCGWQGGLARVARLSRCGGAATQRSQRHSILWHSSSTRLTSCCSLLRDW